MTLLISQQVSAERADVLCAKYKKQQYTENCIQVYGKAIQPATTLSQYLQGKHIHISVYIYTCNYRGTHTPEAGSTYMQRSNPQKPGRQPGVTPNALLDHINTIAPPKVVCHRREPPTQVLPVTDLLKCQMCEQCWCSHLHCTAMQLYVQSASLTT